MTLRVADVMTAPEVTVTEETGFQAVVELLAAHQVSALPVVDAAGRLTGVVSEADLLLKEAVSGDEPHWFDSRSQREARAKASARVVRDLMTAPAVSVTAGTTVIEAARRLHSLGFKRLPVVDEEGRPVGVISRADVVALLLRGDEEIRNDVTEIATRVLTLDPDALSVAVADGTLTLAGTVPRRSDAEMLEQLAREVPGVVVVHSVLRFAQDDAGRTERRLALLDAGG